MLLNNCFLLYFCGITGLWIHLSRSVMSIMIRANGCHVIAAFFPFLRIMYLLRDIAWEGQTRLLHNPHTYIHTHKQGKSEKIISSMPLWKIWDFLPTSASIKEHYFLRQFSSEKQNWSNQIITMNITTRPKVHFNH